MHRSAPHRTGAAAAPRICAPLSSITAALPVIRFVSKITTTKVKHT